MWPPNQLALCPLKTCIIEQFNSLILHMAWLQIYTKNLT
ncbi:hypothetical protein A6R68_13633 [Neotoma lepida]|uniref:Uncharacterized protein n=1 Tax=Neotoma lepida TaxID=56216 RepID=A0A1A6H2F2_NEOLE|nr:hypothetical protein A6R68_13633 [Neotoma lepida]